MTEQELRQGYEAEIAYQKHMLENLGRWFSLCFALAGVGLVLVYFFCQTSLVLFTVGIILAGLGILAMLVFGYGIYKGRLNLRKVLDDFEEKLARLN